MKKYVEKVKSFYNTPVPDVRPLDSISVALKCVLLTLVFFLVFNVGSLPGNAYREVIEFLCIGISLYKLKLCDEQVSLPISRGNPPEILSVLETRF
jgi:hypothetical protein